MVRKDECEVDHLFFTRYFFKARQSILFRVNWHHHFIADIIEKIISCEIKNVVINVSPGSSKTELIVINLIARGLAKNPRARFLHLSYSDDLALQNSQVARDMVRSEEYQAMWPMAIADDSKSKKRWNVMLEGKPAGGVYAVSLGGQITGFRAGHMAEGFQGALIIDDPLKPDDAFSPLKVTRANRQLIATVKSRLANPDTPMVMIMQRVAELDPTGFVVGKCEKTVPIRKVKSGNLGGEWTHVVIPAVLDEAYVKLLPKKYQVMIERDAKERFSYWPYKERIGDLLKMERGDGEDQSGARISRHVFASQYQQNPVAIGGNIIKSQWFHKYTVLPKIIYRKIYVDTAQKTKERNDRSCFECWGYGEDGKIYLLDLLKGKWEAPELESKAIAFWAKHKPTDKAMGQLRKMLVEDKSSGTGLVQKIRLLNHIPIEGIERNIDKLTRVMDGVGYIEAGMVCVPADAEFTNDFLAECEAFTADDSHQYDDQIDPTLDAIKDMLQAGNKLATWAKII